MHIIFLIKDISPKPSIQFTSTYDKENDQILTFKAGTSNR